MSAVLPERGCVVQQAGAGRPQSSTSRHSPLFQGNNEEHNKCQAVLKSPAVQVPYTGTLFLVPPKVNVIIFGLYQIKSRLVLFIAL